MSAMLPKKAILTASYPTIDLVGARWEWRREIHRTLQAAGHAAGDRPSSTPLLGRLLSNPISRRAQHLNRNTAGDPKASRRGVGHAWRKRITSMKLRPRRIFTIPTPLELG